MNIKSVHCIGIKGVGMTALALYCKEKGLVVTGSDTSEEFHTDQLLKDAHIKVYEFGKSPINASIDLIVFSGAYEKSKNKELKEAEKYGIKTMSHGEALGYFMKGSYQISVSGTHGKTTTTSLTVTILSHAGKDPSYIIGAASFDPLVNPGHFGKGAYFVSEADEYQTAIHKDNKPRFMWQDPSILVVTNIDFDHPDVYKDINEVKNAFKMLVGKVPKDGFIVYNGDDKNVCDVVKSSSAHLISFGTGENNMYRVQINKKGTNNTYIITHEEKTFNIPSSLIGIHNGLNISASFIVGLLVHIDVNKIIKGISLFKGAKRRLEFIKESNGILYYDDYAHHPTEIKSSINALKSRFPDKRIIVVFQPHTFSRTKALFNDFKTAFDKVDMVILMPIFASARENISKFDITDEDMLLGIQKSKKEAFLASNPDKVVQYMQKYSKKGDIVVTMGAGDVYKVHSFL